MTALESFRNHVLLGLTLGLLLTGFSALTATPAFACSCIMPPPPAEAKKDAVHVFAGEVLEIEEVGTGMYVDVRIRVDEAWKGVGDQEITVRTPNNSAACGFYFETGKEYLVYTSEMEGEIQVSLCSRTALLSDAAEDLEALGNSTLITDSAEPEADVDEIKGAASDDEDGRELMILGGGILGLLGIAGTIAMVRRRR